MGTPLKEKTMTAYAEKLVAENPVVIFSKTTCPFCKQTKSLIVDKLGYDALVVELDVRDDGPSIQHGLAELTGQKTVPNVFIGGKSVGGNDAVQALHKKKQLVPLLDGAGASASSSSSGTGSTTASTTYGTTASASSEASTFNGVDLNKANIDRAGRIRRYIIGFVMIAIGMAITAGVAASDSSRWYRLFAFLFYVMGGITAQQSTYCT